jgi:hypothetical protein
MKKVGLLLITVIMLNFSAFATIYYSKGSLDVSVATNWNTARDGSGTNASIFGTSNTWVIQNTNSMTLSGTTGWSLGATNGVLIIENGGTWTNSSSGSVTLGTFYIYGGGKYIHSTGSTMTNEGSQHRYFADATNGGNGNGTVEIQNQSGSAILSTAPTWGNVIINLQVDPGGTISGSASYIDVRGDFTVQNTQSRNYTLVAGQTTTHNFGGGLTISGGTLTIASGNSGTGTPIVNVTGNLNISSGTFTMTSSTSTGTPVLNLAGNFNMTGGTLNNSSSSTGYGTINFTGASKTFTKSAGTISSLVNFSIVSTGSINFGTNILDGSTGTFTLASGGTIGIGSTDGISSSGATGNIQVSGTRTFDPGANYNYNGSSGGQVTGTGLPASITGSFQISNSAGLTLSSGLTTSALTLTSGKITLGGNNLSVGTISGGSASSYILFNAAGTGSIALNVSGTSSWLLPVGTASNYSPLTLQYTVAPTAGVITLNKVTPDMNGSVISALNDGGYSVAIRSNQYWSFTNTATGGTYNLSLDGSSSQTGITDEEMLRIVHSADGTTFDLVGTHSDGLGSTAKRTGIPDGTSGRFYLGGQDPTNNPLPVELSTFTANLNGRNIQLNWETKTEKNSNKFEIQRSLTSYNNWASIGSVKAAVLSNSTKQYSYTDKNLQTGKYQYRLKMIDNDGTFEFSKIVETVITLPKNFELNQNYPNPFNPSTKISYSLPNDSKVTLDIYNIVGERVGQLVNQDQAAGYYSVDFNSSVVKSLSSGVYLYRIHAIDNSTGKDFSSVKKMVMLK